MLDPIINFFTRIFHWIGRGIGLVIAAILWPFLAFGRWYAAKGWILKSVLGAGILGLFALYAYFIVQTQLWTNFDPDHVNDQALEARSTSAGEQVAAEGANETTRTCMRSAIVDVTADLVDFNVNENAWISSMLLYKLGLFGIDWDATPWLDNMASFQRGVHQAVQRTSVELTDTLGRVRGTSQVDPDLQNARGNIQFDEYTWYFGLSPFGPKTPTPDFYRQSVLDLRNFNDRLEDCNATFDARADNLIQFVDRIAKDIGSTSATIKDRSEASNAGWFDTRADNLFWYSYGQLYGYYAILQAAHADFDDVIESRRLDDLWNNMEAQIRSALALQPYIISNGREDGWVMPTHLTTMGFYILRVRSNLVEIRSVLDR